MLNISIPTNNRITHFGLLSPSCADGSSGFVSIRGDGELGRSLSPDKSALSRSGRFRPPPRARRAHDRSEQDTGIMPTITPGDQKKDRQCASVILTKTAPGLPLTATIMAWWPQEVHQVWLILLRWDSTTTTPQASIWCHIWNSDSCWFTQNCFALKGMEIKFMFIM
jgi:hypothetical protein